MSDSTPKYVLPPIKSATIKRPRGARETPFHRLSAAPKFKGSDVFPSQFARIPQRLSYWLNNQYGICVTTEEAFAKACHDPEYFMSDATVKAWAQRHGVLNGAYLLEVLEWMQAEGFSQDSRLYNDGSHALVDFGSAEILCSAIVQGPVKIGVSADQLDTVVTARSGWFGVGFKTDNNTNHCVSLSGYGPISWLAQQLGVQVPANVDGTALGYLLFTWNTIGIVDHPSMRNITSEAWIRNPTTITIPPDPTPPPPPPAPTPPLLGDTLTLVGTRAPGVYPIGELSGDLEALRQRYRPGLTPQQWLALILAILNAILPLITPVIVPEQIDPPRR